MHVRKGDLVEVVSGEDRGKRAKVIRADGEFLAAETLGKAARIIRSEPPALQLRYLQTLAEISGEGNTTRTVTISDTTGDGTLGISLLGGTAFDSAGNPAPPAGPSATFVVANAPPGP